MTATVFLFGTLRHAPLREVVLGSGGCEALGCTLPGYGLRNLDGYPVLVEQQGESVDGLAIAPTLSQLSRLDFYESLFGYTRKLRSDGNGRQVWVYGPGSGDHDQLATPWNFASWCDRLGDAATLAAIDVMALARLHPPERVAVRYPMLLSHACARLRGRAEPSPETLRRPATSQDVEPVATRHPYAYFFGVQSDDLRFRRFDGTLSPVVRRAGFVMSDAVTVLPYDPARDCVMLVEQFRYGLYLRDASNCWSLEPIAGRIDPGEIPEQAALREAQEEAGLVLSQQCLHLLGQAYPSPGAITECLFQYVALCRLPDDDRAIGGLESEQEDIRRQVVPFDRLMALVQSGEAQNGPLQTTTYWLALNRDRLRSIQSGVDL